MSIDVEELERLIAAGDPQRPWIASDCTVIGLQGFKIAEAFCQVDAQLIAVAVNALPALIAELRALRKVKEEAREAIAHADREVFEELHDALDACKETTT